MSSLWADDPDSRPTAEQCLNQLEALTADDLKSVFAKHEKKKRKTQ
jgi:hypothetical protein